ncbi:hypothetical protein B0H13DRAFT_2341929 [Mycena leptocephala]|nr:hypothetical protein B0H13DRAFT_2341929 [Mycena leptocephala]
MPSCTTIDTRIHRLPTETLIFIFLFHADPFAYKSIFKAPNFRNELEHLANLRLLTLSQVCSRWHTTVLETPTFWTKIDLNCVLWRTSSCLDITVALLASTLRRGRDLPLILQITSNGNIPLHPASSICLLVTRVGLEGRLPILEELQLDPLRVSPPNPFNYLKGAPALRRLHVTSPLLDGLSRNTLQNLVAYVDNILVHFRVGKWPSPHSLEMLAQILASLTLPALREIHFGCVRYPRGILEWPHAQFVALSERSGFPHTLKILNVAHVRMAEPALLEVLEGADVVLITDTLLRAITCAAPGPDATDTTSLIPRLRVLRCASRLQFKHNLLLEFVSSRLELAPNFSPFLLEVRPLTEADGLLDAEVHERLEAMWSRRRRFGYCFGSAEYPVLL